MQEATTHTKTEHEGGAQRMLMFVEFSLRSGNSIEVLLDADSVNQLEHTMNSALRDDHAGIMLLDDLRSGNRFFINRHHVLMVRVEPDVSVSVERLREW